MTYGTGYYGDGTPDFKGFIDTAVGACVVLPLILM